MARSTLRRTRPSNRTNTTRFLAHYRDFLGHICRFRRHRPITSTIARTRSNGRVVFRAREDHTFPMRIEKMVDFVNDVMHSVLATSDFGAAISVVVQDMEMYLLGGDPEDYTLFLETLDFRLGEEGMDSPLHQTMFEWMVPRDRDLVARYERSLAMHGVEIEGGEIERRVFYMQPKVLWMLQAMMVSERRVSVQGDGAGESRVEEETDG